MTAATATCSVSGARDPQHLVVLRAPTITLRDLAWTAGFLEGEGCFRHRISSGTTACVSANQVQKEPLTRIQSVFGGHVNPRPSRNPRHRDQWVWTLTGVRAVGLMMTLYPMLSPRRQERVREALTAWRSLGVRNQHKAACKRGHPFDAANTRLYIRPATGRTSRWCRACKRARRTDAA